MIEITPLVDPTDADLEALAALSDDIRREDVPDEPPTPVDTWRDRFRDPSPVVTMHHTVARDGGELIGFGELALPREDGRREMAVAYVGVARGRRREGIGRRLLEVMVELARADGRAVLVGQVATTHEAGMAFAESTGATRSQLDRDNRLQMSDLDRGMLERWVARAHERAVGYSLVGWDGPCPDEWLEPYARLLPVMNDAPHHEARGTFAPSPEQVREATRHFARLGHESWTLCVRHDATGELVGLTELGFNFRQPSFAGQGDTGVLPAHRNKGLGRWLKAVNALRVLDERPDVVEIRTGNADTNDAMLSINDAMGFRTVLEIQEWVLPI